MSHSFTLDLAVLCPTKQAAIDAQHLLATWLGTRGLRLSEAKTRIRHLTEGFDFLGFNIRHYPTPHSSRRGYKLLIKPSKDSIQQIRRKFKALWRQHVGSPTVALINALNLLIRGWSQYFCIGVASEAFTDLDHFMYGRAQRDMKRRHPTKSGWWRTQKYWGWTGGARQARWVFQDKERHATLRKVAWTRIVRHRLVPKTYAPDDPTLQAYWRQRRTRLHATAEGHEPLARRQQGLCPVCHQTLENGEALHIHHVVPKKQGGTDVPGNLRLVHHPCHRQIHSTSAPPGVRRLLEPCTR
jgi:RNA-directed DNA polymerase